MTNSFLSKNKGFMTSLLQVLVLLLLLCSTCTYAYNKHGSSYGHRRCQKGQSQQKKYNGAHNHNTAKEIFSPHDNRKYKRGNIFDDFGLITDSFFSDFGRNSFYEPMMLSSKFSNFLNAQAMNSFYDPYRVITYEHPFVNSYRKLSTSSYQILENDSKYQIIIEMPDTRTENINVELSGVATDELILSVDWISDQGQHFVHHFSLGKDVIHNKGISSFYENGILYINMLKYHTPSIAEIPVKKVSDDTPFDDVESIGSGVGNQETAEKENIKDIEDNDVLVNISQDENDEEIIDFDLIVPAESASEIKKDIEKNTSHEESVVTADNLKTSHEESQLEMENEEFVVTADDLNSELISVINEMMKLHNITRKTVEAMHNRI